MAGIGFSLRKMMSEKNTYGTQVRAWFHTSIVAAGPWVISILTINLLLYFSRRWDIPFVERELLISTIIYSTLFSQLITAPFQMLMTRYIADRIFSSELEYIKPSFWGVSLLMLLLGFGMALLFYWNSGLPLVYVYLAVALFLLLTVMWMLMVYLSTLRNFKLVTASNLIGALVTFGAVVLFSGSPVYFREMSGTTNLLLAYLLGIFMILLFLLVVFLAELSEDNGKIFHFIRYFHAVPSLWPIGLFYTASLWIDNVLMWFSPISIDLYGVFRYAPAYDIATFYAYLITLPATMMFMVLIETDFYGKCREFYLAVLENAELQELRNYSRRMRESLFQDVLKTFEVQLFITVLVIVLSPTLFPFLNISEGVRKIFTIYALGALCNSFVLIFLQVLLYIGERNRALALAVIFFLSNLLFTYISIGLGEAYYGTGFFMAGFVSMLFGAFISYHSYFRIIPHTFMTQPVYTRTKKKIFEKVEEWIDERRSARDAFELNLLRKKHIERSVIASQNIQAEESKRAGVGTGTGMGTGTGTAGNAGAGAAAGAGVAAKVGNTAAADGVRTLAAALADGKKPIPLYDGSMPGESSAADGESASEVFSGTGAGTGDSEGAIDRAADAQVQESASVTASAPAAGPAEADGPAAAGSAEAAGRAPAAAAVVSAPVSDEKSSPHFSQYATVGRTSPDPVFATAARRYMRKNYRYLRNRRKLP